MTQLMTDKPTTTAAADCWTRCFEAIDTDDVVYDIRSKAFERFLELGFPHRKNEQWKYTSTRKIAETDFGAADGDAAVTLDDLQPHLLGSTQTHRLVFVNGRFDESLSNLADLPADARIKPLSQAMAEDVDTIARHFARAATAEDRPFVALNTALFTDGLFVHLPKDADVADPIHVIHVTVAGAADASMNHSRNLIVAEHASRATIIETHVGFGDARYLATTTTEIINDADATIDHYKIERETRNAYHIGNLYVHQYGAGNITSHNFSIGGALVRNDVNCALAAEGCEATFNGLTLAESTQHIDNHLYIDHLKPHCNSWEFYKGVFDDKATGVFAGRIFVEKNAQKTDAKQTSMNLLLSDGAQINTKPQLEIYADDVKCTHGATIGQLDETHMFYLRARGIPKDAARSLLIYAFANENIAEVNVPELREKLEMLLLDRLPEGEIVRKGKLK